MYRWMMSIVVNHLSLSLPYLRPQGFLLVFLLRLLGLTFLSPLLVPPLLVMIPLQLGFYPSLVFPFIWLIVMIEAYMWRIRSIRLILKPVVYMTERWLMGAGLVVSLPDLISSSFSSRSRIGTLTTSQTSPRYPTTLI